MKDRFKSFTALLAKINRNIKRIKTEEVKEYGLKSPHVSCIYYLYTEKKLTSKQLVEYCDEDKAAISRTINFLEKNSFIKCEDDVKKRYRNNLMLTEKGLEVGKIIADKINTILEEASSGLAEENRIILYQSLDLINNNLQNIVKGK